MSCRACAVAEQLVCNLLLAADLFLNGGLLAGDPRETLSRRTSRARDAGSKPAKAFCAVLTFLGNLAGADRDHCTWAAAPGPSIGGEIWHWSKPVPADQDNG